MGAKAVCGLYMLVAQAVFACQWFLNKAFDKEIIEKVYKDIRISKENVVLIGMPSCGKSTVGEFLAKKTGRHFYYTDFLIEEKTGKHPSYIITEQGEAAFRDIESRIVKEVSAKSGVIIATGGGAILREENRNNLRKNGTLWFIDRPLDKLITTSDRPLSSSREALTKRYNERYPIYTDTADYIIKNIGSIEQAAEQIEKDLNK